ncbi:patatin-like phospholipase family protein [bacterium]|nr:MAG: patatin-like phospholipase family protein [bacterium]
MQNKRNKIRVGFAFSGASTRSIFYIGFLEALKENGYPIDYIASMSGATIVAASFASGTMDKLKEMAFSINKEVVLGFLERSRSKGGLYHLRKVEELLRTFTKNYNFEDVSPRLGFVATDIVAGEEVVLQVGDLAKAICASCTLPVVFEPQPWGNKVLVDGGIINIVPGNVARQAGMDLIIGVDLRATRHVFSPWQIFLRKAINRVKKVLWPQFAKNFKERIMNQLRLSEFWEDNFYLGQTGHKLTDPNLLTVIGRSLDIAIEAQQRDKHSENFECDMLIVPELELPFWKRNLFLRFTHVDNTKDYYLAGRKAAEEYLPKMWQLLKDKEEQEKARAKQLETLFTQTENNKTK